MLSDLKGDAFLLAYTMSNISELSWSAGWMQNLEYVLWHAVLSGRREWGQGLIGSDDIAALKLLAGRIDGWIYYDDEQEETYIPLAEWQQKFDQVTRANPGVLD